MLNSLDLTLFGSPEVRRCGQLVIGFRTGKAQALLYYLAVTGRPYSRSTLAGLLWGDQPEAAARASLSKCLSNLHDLLGDAVLVERQTAAFNRAYPYQLDTECLLASISTPPTAETIQRLQSALALYRGDFLEGFYVREAPEFEQWLLTQRAQYREAVLSGLHGLANYAEQQGELPAAITHTRRLLTVEPWHEEAHRLLITLLARTGQRSAALAQFEICRRVLDEELAAEPDAETLALVQAIRSGEFDRVMARQGFTVSTQLSGDLVNRRQVTLVTTPLPTPPTPLFGRERELAALGELIINPQCKLITITGPGGIGKTRLALAAAADQTGQFQDGAVFVPLAGVSSAQFLPQAILGALNVPLRSDLSPQQQVWAVLSNQNQLLVLDNYEHLLPDVELLIDLLHYAPQVTWLVTSRERLALQAEHLFALRGLAYPQTPEATQMADFAAVHLFLQRVRQFQPHFTSTATDLAAIIRICRLVEGLPLALELAASAVRSQSLPELAEALAQGQLPPAATMRDRPARHHSLAAAFEHSWHLLTARERQVFAQLSVFRAGFTQNAGQTVADASPELLSGLLDKSLIRQQAEDRFDLHELLRQAGETKLGEAGAIVAVRVRHLQYFLALAELLETQLIRAPESPALDAFERDYENIRSALQWGLISPDAEPTQRWQAVWLVARLGLYWHVRNHWSEGRLWLTHALHVVEHIPSRHLAGDEPMLLRANLLYRASTLALDCLTQQQMLEESLTLFQQCEDQQAIVRCLHDLASNAVELGNYQRAAIYIQESLALARHVNDEGLITRSLLNLADLMAEEEDFHQSMAYAGEALTLSRKMDDPGPLTSALNLLAQAAIGLGDYHQAYRWLEEIFQHQRQHGPYSQVGPWTFRNLGLVQQMLGNYDAAIAAYAESLRLRYKRQQLGGIAWALEGLGETMALCGHPVRAAVLWGVADNLRQQDGSTVSRSERQRFDSSVAMVRNQLGELAFTQAWSEGVGMGLEQAVAYALSTPRHT